MDPVSDVNGQGLDRGSLLAQGNQFAFISESKKTNRLF
jgi:hypothetical protein